MQSSLTEAKVFKVITLLLELKRIFVRVTWSAACLATISRCPIYGSRFAYNGAEIDESYGYRCLITYNGH